MESKQSKQIDDNYPEQVKKYSMQLIDLYEKTCDQQNYREELLYMLINCKQNDLTYFMKLKDEVSQLDKWENLVEEILLNNRDVYFECKVLNEEKHYQQLADVITRSENLYLMDEYMKVLRNNSPQIVIEFYKKYVLKEVQRVSNRNGYRHLMEYLKKIKNCPGGNAVAVSIANQWKIEYKRRTAMMDELRKIGL